MSLPTVTGGLLVAGLAVVGVLGFAEAGTMPHWPGLKSKSSTAISP